MNNDLFSQIEEFYVRLQLGHFDHPYDLAKALEALSNQAWDEVDTTYQPSLLP